MALDEIIAYKRSELKRKQAEVESYKATLAPAKRDVKKALQGATKSGFICEIKFASPSRGAIRSASVEEIANIYEPFADVISVLADEKYFGGSPHFVKKVSALSKRPVLFKDVIVSELQVYEARFFEADAVLLMLSVLDDEAFRECSRVAKSLNMQVICEVHSDEEMNRAANLNPDIIGINNRNLKTLHIDLETSERLLPLAPKGALVLVESGISSRSEIKRFNDRANGFLIGTSLMKSSRTDLALRELLFGRVKICGLTNATDATNAYAAGAYYGGLNFSTQSKRSIGVSEASAIRQAAPLKWGGVFVNQTVDEVSSIAHELHLNFVQLHGDEDAGYVSKLRSQLHHECELWKALRISDEITEPQMNVDRFLIDSFSKSAFGGTGKSFDWDLLRHDERRHDYVIAGGINATNIGLADELAPFAIDIASGVEDDNPRRKSLVKLREIFSQLRA